MSDNISYQMPFGAELETGGKVRFRLWAPGGNTVDVCLYDGSKEKKLTMAAAADSWFEITTTSAPPGTYYRFCIDGDHCVPDPASRFQPEDVHGPSEVIDPSSWRWQDAHWMGRPWEETVVYELHVGSFTPEGNFAGVMGKLDYLRDLGVTAIELMPVADFPGKHNWGYDGTYLFAPDSRYGRPDDLKALIDAAHARNLMVFLDVVYNHFGPEGNYLHLYAPQFFTEKHRTPWGAAINFDDEYSHWVRQFFIHNALYWLKEYHIDGLRLDAVHAILDDSQPDILTELAQRVQTAFPSERHIHLILENDHNAAHYLERDAGHKPCAYAAQWNDDIHHALHVITTGETGGYYMDYAQNPILHLGRCLAEGFAYQGDCSPYRNGEPRGEPSRHLPPTAFVSFLQNHDQVGNRAFGERIQALASPQQIHAAAAILLLAPSPPLLFMGEEWGSCQPFPFFCDFGTELADAVVNGRREEFARFPEFSNPDARARIPNPMEESTFQRAVLNWLDCDRPEHASWLTLYRELLALRHRYIVPCLSGLIQQPAAFNQLGGHGLKVNWILADNTQLSLIANLGDEVLSGCSFSPWKLLYATHSTSCGLSDIDVLPPWSVIWYLSKGAAK